jgi:hypothetical protein
MPRDITVTFDDGTSHVYRGAPDDVTPDAVQARAAKEFGKIVKSLDGGRQAAPPTPAGQIPGAAPGMVAPPAVSEVPMGRRAIRMVRPTVEALGSAGGAVLGGTAGTFGAGPVGTVVGGLAGEGLGYGLAKGGLDVLETALGYRQGPRTAEEAVVGGATDVATGSLMGGIGRGVIAPAIKKGAEAVARLGAGAKIDTYRKALEGKGDDILALLRGAPSKTPGAAPGAGEVAAPAGSAQFSNLQKQGEELLGTEVGFMRAQTAAAQAAQQGRAQAKFDAAAAKVQSKMNSALAPLRPEDAGAALVAGAEAKREAMKKGVIEPAYAAAFKEAGDAKIDMRKVIGEAESILGRKLSDFDPSTAPETVRKLLSLQPKAPPAKPLGAGVVSGKIKQAAPAAPPPEVTLQQLDDIRKAVNVDIAAGRTSMDPGAGMRLRSLDKIHKAIDDAVESSTTLSATAKTAYDDALNLYRTEYVPRFKTGVNDQMFRATALNEPKIKPEDVITKYFQPRGVSEARNFVTLFGDDPKAMQTARAGIEDLYMREVKVPTPEAHAAFLQKYADPIKVLDDAGMNVLQRIKVVGQNAARLDKINELAKQTNVKLSPPLPPGATADAVERRLQMLTKGLSPQELSHVNAVQQDLLRRGEYERLAALGEDAAPDISKAGKAAMAEVGLPTRSYLNRLMTLFNEVSGRIALRVDAKTAMEIAREMTNPALAAKSVEQALKLEARLAGTATGAAARETLTRGAMIGSVNALAPESQNQNALAP